MAKYSFMRHGEVYERRMKINRVEKEIEQEDRWHYFTTAEVQKILCNSRISVTKSTVRNWIKKRLLPAHKKGQYKRYWITQNGFRILIEIMHYFNEREFEYENDPLEMRPDAVKIRRQYPERNRDGTFKRKKTYNHHDLYGRLN